MSKLSHTRDKIYKIVARQLHGQVPCWVCGEHVLPAAATLEHILPLSEGGSSHQDKSGIISIQTFAAQVGIFPTLTKAHINNIGIFWNLLFLSNHK